MKNEKFVSVDWGHKDSHEMWFDGEEVRKTMPKDAKIVLVENIPVYKAKELVKKGIKILTCHTMSSRDHREEMGYPRLKHYKNDGHAIDAKVIYDLYVKKPEVFYEWFPNEMQYAYNNFLQIQKSRIAAGNRAWSEEAKEKETKMIDFLRKAEVQAEKRMDQIGEDDATYQYLGSIKYIGARTGGGIRGLLDPSCFPTASKMRRYAGLSVIDGNIQERRKGESSGYNAMAKSILLSRVPDSFIKSKGKDPSPYLKDYVSAREKFDKQRVEIPLSKKHKIIGDILSEDVNGFKVGQRIYKHQFPKLRAKLESQGRNTVYMELSDGHAHRMAIRKMMTKFLEDYWVVSRQLEGFPTVAPYPIDVQGHSHYRPPHYIPDILEPFEPERELGWIFKEGKRPLSEACPYIKDKLKDN